MSDNLPAPITSSKISIWLPCVSLALTLVAYGLDAPARLAHLNLRPTTLIAGLEFDESIRYEPALSMERTDYRLVSAQRVLDTLLSQQLIALR